MNEDALNNGNGAAVEMPKPAEPQLGGIGSVMHGGNMGSTEGPGAIVQQKAGEVAAIQAAPDKKPGLLGKIGSVFGIKATYESPKTNDAGAPTSKIPEGNGMGLAPQPPDAAPLETRPDGTVTTPQMKNVTPEAQAAAETPAQTPPPPVIEPISDLGQTTPSAEASTIPTPTVEAPPSPEPMTPTATPAEITPEATVAEITIGTPVEEPERSAVATEVAVPAVDTPVSPGLETTTPVPPPDLTANGQEHQEIHETDLMKAATATEADEKAQAQAEQTNTVENRPPDPLAVPEFHPTEETSNADISKAEENSLPVPNPDAVASGGDLNVTAEEPDKTPEDQQWHVEAPASHPDPLAVPAPTGAESTAQPPTFSSDALTQHAGDPAVNGGTDGSHEEASSEDPLPIPGPEATPEADDSSKWQVQAGTPAPAGEISDDTQKVVPPVAETSEPAPQQLSGISQTLTMDLAPTAEATEPREEMPPATIESDDSAPFEADSTAVETPVASPPVTATAVETPTSDIPQQQETVFAGQTPTSETPIVQAPTPTAEPAQPSATDETSTNVSQFPGSETPGNISPISSEVTAAPNGPSAQPGETPT